MIQVVHSPLAPDYPEWPEMPFSCATVVCEGPSAFNARPEDILAECLPGPILAVNRAIAFSDDIPFDFWATFDDPQNLWGWAQPHLHPEAKLFTADGKVVLWGHLPVDLTRLYAWHQTIMEAKGMEDQNGLCPLVPTLFPLLAWILSLGVQEVKLIGVDMSGSGTPFLDDWQDVADEGYQLRWEVERQFLAHSARFYRAKGARLTRWDPSKTFRR